MNPVTKVLTYSLLGFVIGIVLAILMGYPTMWLMNYLFTTHFLLGLFGVSKMTFWRAFWFNFLCSTLFKSIKVSAKS